MDTKNEDIAYEIAMLLRKYREKSEALETLSNKLLRLEQENTDLYDRLEEATNGNVAHDIGMLGDLKVGDKIVIKERKGNLTYCKGYVLEILKTPSVNSHGIVCVGVKSNNGDGVRRTIRSTNYKWAKVNPNTPLSSHRFADNGDIEYSNLISL